MKILKLSLYVYMVVLIIVVFWFLWAVWTGQIQVYDYHPSVDNSNLSYLLSTMINGSG